MTNYKSYIWKSLRSQIVTLDKGICQLEVAICVLEMGRKELITNCDNLGSFRFTPSPPFAFTEQVQKIVMQFASIFHDKEIVVSLIRHLSWTHILALIPIEDLLKRQFYIEMCKLEKWSVRTLRERINSMLYERTAISTKPSLLLKIKYQAEKIKPYKGGC